MTIPEDVRRFFKVKEGDIIDIQALDTGKAVLRKQIPDEELAGVWDEEMDEAMGKVGEIWKTWKLPKKSKTQS